MTSPIAIALEVIGLLESVGIRYVLGGALASSTFGEPRATNDVDLAISLELHQLPRLIDTFQRADYYVPERSAEEAVTNRGSFNVLPPSSLKIDLFVVGSSLLDRLQMERRVAVTLPRDPPAQIWVTSPADQILRKLHCYRLGQEVSDRQWRDILGLLTAQGATLDLASLREDAEAAGLDDLLDRALAEAGPRP